MTTQQGWLESTNFASMIIIDSKAPENVPPQLSSMLASLEIVASNIIT